MEQQVQGIGVSPGIAIGRALLFDTPRHRIPEYRPEDLEQEVARFNAAIESTRKDLERLYQQTLDALGERHADIFNVHLMLLDDVALKDEVEAEIRKGQQNAEAILDALAKRYVKVMESVDDLHFRERAADLLDVVDRLLHALSDRIRPNLKHLDTECIIIANKISPSDTATMDTDHVLAIIMETGGVTSHTAILARALEIPAVMGADFSGIDVADGEDIIVDGAAGLVIISPEPATITRYIDERELYIARQKELQKTVARACKTKDGKSFPVLANIELPVEVATCHKNFAEGIGLFRTEYLFLDRTSLPTEEEQFEAYASTLAAMAPAPVTLRTLDIGGDKFADHMPYLGQKEDNPQLGWRAVRFCLANPDIFKTQLRAMLRASTRGNLSIMFPMISGVTELRKSKNILEEVKQELVKGGIPFSPDIKIGTMIEIPSAVVLADLLAKEADFFSIGTNDLIQYSLAVDRTNQKIAHLYEPTHPAVLHMIKMTADAAERAHIPCSICGEMAGDPRFSMLLLGLGVTSLSMSAFAIPAVREAISAFSMEEAHTISNKALTCATAGEVDALLEKHLPLNISNPTANV